MTLPERGLANRLKVPGAVILLEELFPAPSSFGVMLHVKLV